MGDKDGKRALYENDLCNFPHGVYDSIGQLAEEINEAKDVSKHQILAPTLFQKGYYSLKRVCECEQPHFTVYNEKIRLVFGFEAPTQRQTGTLATSNTELGVVVGSLPASLARAIPDQLFVYTDIWEPYTVSDTRAALRRIVSLDSAKYKFGSHAVRHFAPVHDIPLLHHSFRSVIIDIRDHLGERIPFEYGTLTVTLHFKRNR